MSVPKMEPQSVRQDRSIWADKMVHKIYKTMDSASSLNSLANKWSEEAHSAPTAKRKKHALEMMKRIALIGSALRAQKPELAVYIASMNSDLSAVHVPHDGPTALTLPSEMVRELRAIGGVTVMDGAQIDLAMHLPSEGRHGRKQRFGGDKGARIAAESRPSADEILNAYSRAKDKEETILAARLAVVAHFKKERRVVSLRRVQDLTTSGRLGRPNK